MVYFHPKREFTESMSLSLEWYEICYHVTFTRTQEQGARPRRVVTLTFPAQTYKERTREQNVRTHCKDTVLSDHELVVVARKEPGEYEL